MPRNSKGWLKADALKAGIPEQYAVIRGDERHEVSIVHDIRQGGFVTQYVVITAEQREVHAWQTGRDLPLAREKFKTIVKSLGGGA